ncbi:MAG: hypothetical protein ACRD1R_20895 [Acidobacteriota bacterium]
MVLQRIFICFVLFLFGFGSAVAQIERLDGPEDFSEEAIVLKFNEITLGLNRVLPNAEDFYSTFGIHFEGEGQSRPVIQHLVVQATIVPATTYTLINQAQDSSANEALIMRFKYPLKRVGFRLGVGLREENGDLVPDDTEATIRTFTARGEFLGEVMQDDINPRDGVSQTKEYPFVGLETSHPSGIATVIVDYGEDEREERIHRSFRLEFLQGPPIFRTYIPQVGDGRAGDLTVRTVIKIEELFNQNTEVRLQLLNGDGGPLTLTLDGETNDTFEFSLPPKGIKQFQTSGGDALSAGYACIESNLPVAADAIYQTFGPDGELLAEAGIQGEEEKTALRGVVDRNAGNGLDVALAFANTSSSENQITFLVRDESGLVPDFDTHLLLLVVAPGHHEAFYISDRFPILRDQNFMGSFEIVGTESLVLTTLRAINGIARSSLPVAGTQAGSKISFPEAAEE